MATRASCRAVGSLPSLIGSVSGCRTFFSLGRRKSRPLRWVQTINNATSLAELTEFSRWGDNVAALTNPDGHDAAVLLTTPEKFLVRETAQPGKLVNLVKTLAQRANIESFHLICGTVDSVAPVSGVVEGPGSALLRCNLEDLRPELGKDPHPQSQQDEDKVGAIAFEMGQTTVTVPLANTTFLNGKTSTLIYHRFSMTDGSPKHMESYALKSKRIRLPLAEEIQSIADLCTHIPLRPITRPRPVVESFGNIVRAIEVKGQRVPASQELEAVINGLRRSRKPGPVGVWAAITPETCPTYVERLMDLTPLLKAMPGEVWSDDTTAHTINTFNLYLQDCYRNGGRIHKILSGGGGWGAKKGLLSIDPEQTHYSSSEEEELLRFAKMMDGGGDALFPEQSKIQYFLSPPMTRDTIQDPSTTSYSFGVMGKTGPVVKLEAPPGGEGAFSHFGACSKDGVFISGPSTRSNAELTETKLSVPDSRVGVTATDEVEIAGGSWFPFIMPLPSIDIF